ncbi:Pseudouridylate synthase [Trichinella spiralis]|uniref:Pseudouridylate synthase n=1 Tax=Trichinella spiralis TaxID=6334 RepID=A0ABR3K525_TRISP
MRLNCSDAINSGTDFELNNQKRQKLENDEETRKIIKAEPTETVRIKRYKYAMFLAYRGKNYHGMQVNPNVPTVEKYIMEALQKLNLITVDQVVQPSLFKFQRAARTDKGVSATKQICSLLLPTIEGKENDTVNLLNGLLPDDIRIFGLQRATKSFDSKKWCDYRSYSYTLPSYCFRHQSDLERDKFRLDNKDIEEINRILMQYVGTHNFYNFTSGKLHKDESCKRFIIRCECGKRFLYNNIEYLTVDIKGQSFLIHQIRKMIGFCISLIRGDLDPCLQQKVWQNERIKVPKAPSLGLVLEEPHYEHYNKRFQATHQRLCWDIYQEKCEEFKQAYIIKDILETDESEKIFEEWLTYLTEKFWNENDVDDVSIVGHSDNVQTDGKSSLKEKKNIADKKKDSTNKYMEQKQQSGLQLPQFHSKNFLNGYLLVKNVTSVLKRLLPRRRLEWLKRVQPLGVIINDGSALPACESQPTTLCLKDSSGARYELTAETKAEMLAWCFMLQGIYKHDLGVFAKLNGSARAQSMKQSHSCVQLSKNVRRLYSLPASGMKAASSLDFDSNFEHFCRNCQTTRMMTGERMEKLLQSFQKVKLSNGSICKSTGSANSRIHSAYNNTTSVVDVLKSLVVEEAHEGCFEVVSLLLQVISKLEKDPNHNFHAELENCFIDQVKLPHHRKKSSGRLRKHLQKKDHQIKVHCRVLRKFTEELFDYKKAYVRCLLSSVRVHTDDMSSFSEISFPIPPDETEYERIEKLANEAKHQDPSVATMEQIMSSRGFTDRYGFQHRTNDEQMAAIYVASCLQHHYTTWSQKNDEFVWKKLIAVFNENGSLHTQDLRCVIRNGVPHKYRSIVWSILLSSKTDKLKEKYGLHYFRRLSCIIDTTETSERHDHNRRQIGLDLLRTLPNNVYFSSANSKGVVQMQRVLSAFCIHNPKLGYCQGMNFVVATSLLFFSPEDSFWFLIALTECYFPKDHYDSLLVGVRAAQAVLRDILRQKLPSLSAHFDLCDFDISVVTLNWFIALFYDALPFDVMLRVWDCFLLEGQKVIYRFAVALFYLHRKEIVAQKDSLSLIRFLKSTVRNTYDVETLTKVAYQTLKPFPKRKELLRCHLHHVMSVKQQTFRLYKLRIEAMRQKNMEKCNLLQCHHVLASVSIPNTETILISFGCNENSQFGLINSRICQFSILPGKVADRILCMTTSNGDIFFASTLSASLFAFRLNKNFQSWQTLWEITIQDVILDMVARGGTIYAALSNGSLAFIQNSGDTTDCADFLNHFYIRISDASPIHRLLLVDNHLWLALGDQIVVYDAGTLDKVEQVKSASSTTSLGRIARMELSRFGIWIYQEYSNTVELWDPRFFTRILSFQVEEYASEPNAQFVSSMCCVEDTLWIGTRVGLLLVYKLEEHDHPADQLPQDDYRAMLIHRDSGYCEGVAHQLSSDPCISGNDWEQLQNEQRQEIIGGCDWKYFGSLDRRQWALKRITEQHDCGQLSRRRRMHFDRTVPMLPKVKEKHPTITTTNHTGKDNNSINMPTLCAAKEVAASSPPTCIGKDNNLSDEWKLTLDESTTTAITLPTHTRSLLQIAGDRLNKPSYLALSSSLESLKQRNTPNTGSCLSVLSQVTLGNFSKPLLLFKAKLYENCAVHLIHIRSSATSAVMTYSRCLSEGTNLQLWSLSADKIPTKQGKFKKIVING